MERSIEFEQVSLDHRRISSRPSQRCISARVTGKPVEQAELHQVLREMKSLS
jgi:hypothetical protein